MDGRMGRSVARIEREKQKGAALSLKGQIHQSGSETKVRK